MNRRKKNPSIYFSCLVCNTLNILINMYIHEYMLINKVFLLIMIKNMHVDNWSEMQMCHVWYLMFHVDLFYIFLSVRKKTE